MIVPQYWAEASARHRDGNRQVTVRRFGWSDASPDEARANAQARADEALRRVLAGEELARREPRVPYNGAQGVPIREEILDRLGETVVTRNAYGARCINTPNVLFADIDFEEPPAVADRQGLGLYVLLAAAIVAGALTHSALLTGLLLVAAFASTKPWKRSRVQPATDPGSAETAARARIAAFVERHPDWRLRVYRTPAGLRVLAMHATFDPRGDAVAECFRALAVDPVYARMCANQACFRARITAKPWRIGIEDHLRPRPGVWPVAPDRLPQRTAWVERYERAAQAYAACRFIEETGGGGVDPEADLVREMHDLMCNATSALPLA